MNRNWFGTSVVICVVALLTYGCATELPIERPFSLGGHGEHSKIVCCLLIPDGNNLLTNGSLEDDPTNPRFHPNVSGGVMSLPFGSTTIPGWTVVGVTVSGGNPQEIAWGGNNNQFVPNGATDGNFFVDLTGVFDRQSADGFFAGVQQTFTTVPNQFFDYELSFDIMVANFQRPIEVIAEIRNNPNDEKPYESKTCEIVASDPPTQTCTKFFKAQSTSTTLTIKATKGNGYVGLDKVFVECLTPFGFPGFLDLCH